MFWDHLSWLVTIAELFTKYLSKLLKNLKNCIGSLIHWFKMVVNPLGWGDVQRAEQFCVQFGTWLANTLWRQFHSDADMKLSVAKLGK